MRPIRTLPLLLVAGLSSALPAAEIPPEMLAKFVKILCGSAGGGTKVASKDAALNGKLTEAGLSIDAGSKIAWAASEADVAAYKAAGKLVICPKLEWLTKGGSVAIVEEGGRPQIILHMGNIEASGVKLSDSILKIGKPIR